MIKLGSERKSRRTHKNSRDGCPNCKAKRIKCTEELPQCFNCIKKNYRCGYLDFPKLRLNHIRLKNENKHKNELLTKLDEQYVKEQSPEGSSQPVDEYNAPIPVPVPVLVLETRVPVNIDTINEDVASALLLWTPHPLLSLSSTSNSRSASSSGATSGRTSLKSSVTPITYSGAIEFNKDKPSYQDQFGPNEYVSNLKDIENEFGYNEYQLRVYQQSLQTLPLHNDILNQLQHSMQNPLLLHSMQTQMQTLMPFHAPVHDPNPLGLHLQDPSPVLMGHARMHAPGVAVGQSGMMGMENGNNMIPLSNAVSAPHPAGSGGVVGDHGPNAIGEGVSNNISGPVPSAGGHGIDYGEVLMDFDLSFNSNQFVNFDNSNLNLLRINELGKSHNHALPNGIHSPTKFTKLKRIARYRKHKYFYLPVFTQKMSQRLWYIMFRTAFSNEVFQLFFLDKSLGFLLSNLNIILTSAYLKSFHNTYHTLNETTFLEDFFYNDKVLNRFINKSHNYYGNLIRDIREKLNNYHIDSTIQISLLSSYASYLLLNSSVTTVTTLNSGASTLLYRFVTEVGQYSRLTVNVRYIIDVLFNHVQTAVVPDLQVDLIEKVANHFKVFKSFLINSTSLYQSLQNSQTIRDFIPKRDCIEFELFLSFLIDDFYPKITKINEKHAKNRLGLPVLSFNLYFELLNKWFKMYPSIVNANGPHINVLQRVYYLFFMVAGKLITQIFTPIRSIMNIDCNHVLSPIVDMNYHSFKMDKINDHLNDDQFNYLNKLNKNLLRLISFCNFRNILYGHYLSLGPHVLDNSYVRRVEGNNDYIEITAEKLSIKETPLNMSEDLEFSIAIDNFPFFPDINLATFGLKPPTTKGIVSDLYDDDNFNYNLGLFKTDYDPSAFINEFMKFQRHKWEFDVTNLATLKTRVKNFHQSRKLINKSVTGFKPSLDV